MNIIDAAVKYAETHYDAFFLIVHLNNGDAFRGGVFSQDPNFTGIRMECPSEDGLRTVFVSMSAINAVEIEP